MTTIQRSEWTNIMVGMATVGALIIVFSLGYQKKIVTEDGGLFTLKAEFNTVDGLSVGDPVTLAGMSIGTITDISLNRETNRPVLKMVLSEPVELPYDSSARVMSRGLAGGKYLKVVPGGEFDMFEDGDSFEYTQGAVLFEEILEKVVLIGEAARNKRKALQDIGIPVPDEGLVPSLDPNLETGTEVETQSNSVPE